jgi:type IV pilus assembly protein PilO
MTYADDFLDEEKGLEGDYPSAFGITFTPIVIGIALAVAGVVGAVYIYMNTATPAREAYQGVKTQLDEKQAQLDQMNETDFPQRMAQLKADEAEQKALKSRVIAMFTNQNDLDTLLLDLNSFVSANQGKLVKYTPNPQIAIIEDSSLGANVNGKLKRQTFSLDVEGTYSQTQAILQDLERLQPLLLIQNYNSKVSQEPTVILASDRSTIVPQNAAILTTSLQIDAILPLSQEEMEAVEKAKIEAAKEELTGVEAEKK